MFISVEAGIFHSNMICLYDSMILLITYNLQLHMTAKPKLLSFILFLKPESQPPVRAKIASFRNFSYGQSKNISQNLSTQGRP